MAKKKAKSARRQGVETVDCEISRCRKCGSTERDRYYAVKRMSLSGVRNGQPYSAIVWKRTKCRNCGQHRVDKSFENAAD